MIRQNNIVLRAVEPSDANLLYQWENNMKLWMVSNTLTPFSRRQIDEYIKHCSLDIFQTKQLRLMIDIEVFANQFETAGMIDLFDFDPYHQRAGVGIMIHQKHREKGIADKTLKAFIQYCFDQLGLHQLYCSISDDNVVSQKLFESNGFRLIGVKKDWRKRPNGFQDEWLYQLIK
jgi:diamine N-acetyltransferase